MTSDRFRSGTRARASWLAAIAGVGAALAAARPAAAALTVEHVPELDPCVEAGTYPLEDDSVTARRARYRCRVEELQRHLDDKRAREETTREARRERQVSDWMQLQEVPTRLAHRTAIDLFGSGGVASYGLAVSWLILSALEGEVWIGKRTVNGSSNGGLWDSRICYGGRFKWLMRSRGDLTPFASLGGAACSANLQTSPTYGSTTLTGTGISQITPGSPGANASGAANLVTATAGLAWMDRSGVRVSLEYIYGYAFYSQATLDDAMRTEDATMRDAWSQRLTSDRQGARLQVGYAF